MENIAHKDQGPEPASSALRNWSRRRRLVPSRRSNFLILGLITDTMHAELSKQTAGTSGSSLLDTFCKHCMSNNRQIRMACAGLVQAMKTRVRQEAASCPGTLTAITPATTEQTSLPWCKQNDLVRVDLSCMMWDQRHLQKRLSPLSRFKRKEPDDSDATTIINF